MRKRWVQLSIILQREEVNPRVLGMFVKAMVQAVLLFWLEIWVMTPRMGKYIGGFNTG